MPPNCATGIDPEFLTDQSLIAEPASGKNVVLGNRRKDDGLKLEFDASHKGGPDVILDPDIWAEGIRDWETSLIGSVFELTPSIFTMRNYVKSRWGGENIVSDEELRKDIFIFYFETKNDMEEVLEKGPWPFNNRPLILQPW